MSILDIHGYCQIQGDSIVSIVFKSLDSANNFIQINVTSL
jgi:hypothetical protein